MANKTMVNLQIELLAAAAPVKTFGNETGIWNCPPNLGSATQTPAERCRGVSRVNPGPRLLRETESQNPILVQRLARPSALDQAALKASPRSENFGQERAVSFGRVELALDFQFCICEQIFETEASVPHTQFSLGDLFAGARSTVDTRDYRRDSGDGGVADGTRQATP
jgi:hypothetical protein